MTLVLALKCAEGFVLASDSQGTVETNGQQVRSPAEKIYRTWEHVAWGAAGSVGTIQRVRKHLEERFPAPNVFEATKPNDVQAKIASEVSKSVRTLFQDQLLNLPGQAHPVGVFLFVGQTKHGPVLFEIGANMADQCHLDSGFAAIGSADVFPYYALAALSHFDVKSLSLESAKKIAYRVMSDAVGIAAFGIGPPIQMIEISCKSEGAGKARKLADHELKILDDQVFIWKTLEVETLEKSMGPGKGDVPVDTPVIGPTPS